MSPVDPREAWRPIGALVQGPVAGVAAGRGWVAAFEDTQGALMVCEENRYGSHDCATRITNTPPLKAPYLSDFIIAHLPHPKPLAAAGDSLLFIRDSLYLSPNRGKSWVNLGSLPGFKPTVVAIHGIRIYLSGRQSSGPDAGSGGAVFSSADGGVSWTKEWNSPDSATAAIPLAFRNGEIYAASASGIFMRRQGEGAWTNLDEEPPSPALGLAVEGNRLVASLEGGHIYARELETSGLMAGEKRENVNVKQRPKAMGLFPDGAGSWRRLDGRAPGR